MPATEKSPLLFNLGHETPTDAYMVLTRGEIRVEGPDDLRKVRDAALVFIENEQAEPDQKGRAFNRLYHFTVRANEKTLQGLVSQAGSLTLVIHSPIADLSSWEISDTIAQRTVYRETGDREVKVWALHFDTGRIGWEVTYNTHPRRPRHLRSGKLPILGDLLTDELISQLRSNPSHGPELRAFADAIPRWAIQRRLDTAVLETLYWQIPTLQHMHRMTAHEEQAAAIPGLIEALDAATHPTGTSLKVLYDSSLQEVLHDVRYKHLTRQLARG